MPSASTLPDDLDAVSHPLGKGVLKLVPGAILPKWMDARAGESNPAPLWVPDEESGEGYKIRACVGRHRFATVRGQDVYYP